MTLGHLSPVCHTLIAAFFRRTRNEQDDFSTSYINSSPSYTHLLSERHHRSKFFGLGLRWFHKGKTRRQSPVQAQPFISVYRLYKQSSSDNRVALQTAHAAIFQLLRLNSRPCAHFLYNRALQLCSTIVETLKISIYTLTNNVILFIYLSIFYFYISRYPQEEFTVPQGTAESRLGITGLQGKRENFLDS
jgi:hypothetical protein